jgi:aryl-alcohol dehydrogenase-like predicted oxidoreductase
VLTGKYNDGAWPEGARFTHYLHAESRQRQMAQRFVNEKTLASTARFQAIAAQAGVSVVSMAVAWSRQHDFVASTIVGATGPMQMPDILAAADITLSDEVLAQIDQVSRDIPYPMG